ncbi:MAG: 3D-(3,5/4)-trihydroxycyclohexane-1,2-dione acylhydrolase (decyclizing) [Eubacteriales bacterium]|nr:3D-(3,5/4)-trihydroxycyclohexane-1,2-dione acylhydrolase (decyclizing) [Eubacteriales bacterium]
MKTIRLTMAQALIRFLENQYLAWDDQEQPFVAGIFVVPGHGNVVGLGQAIAQEARRMKIYQGKNEQGMAHAAMAFAKQKKRKQIMAATSSVGPGAANMITACATATANNIPLLVLPGDTFASRQPDPVLQQIEMAHSSGISTNDAFRSVCRYFDRIERPEQVMVALLNAMRVLTDPADTGAVCLALPQDVEGEAYEYPEMFFQRRVHRLQRRPPEKEAVALAAERVREARKPLLICGGGVRYSEAHEAFAHFAERFNIPFGETQAGKSALVWNHPLNLGGIGVTGTQPANILAKEADLIIGVGTRYTDFTTASKWLFNDRAKFLNINVSPFQAMKMEALPLIADARMGLEALNDALGDYRSGYSDEIGKALDDWEKELSRLDGMVYDETHPPLINDRNADSAGRYARDLGSALTQTAALGALNKLIPKDAVVIGSSGSLPGDMQRMWRPKTPDSYNMEYGYSCMGYEVSGALGQKLAADGKEVYSMVGDGSFVMLHSELLTAVQEKLKINICLFDNAGFGCINNLQIGQGNESLCTELRYRSESGRHDGSFLAVDYARIAEGYGCIAFTIRTLAELEAAVKDALTIKGQPVLFDLKVLPKTMTDGYASWWRVGSVEVSRNPLNEVAWQEHLDHINNAKAY